MSKDGRYLLSYECHSYVEPTPMFLDKDAIRKQFPEAEFVMLDKWTIYFEMPKYTLLPDIVSKLKADAIFEAIDGDPFKPIQPKQGKETQ